MPRLIWVFAGRTATLMVWSWGGSINMVMVQFQMYMDRVKRIWYLSHMRAAKVQASLRIRAVSPEPPLLAHTSSESRGTFRQKERSLAPLNGWACAVKICHDGMLEDTNSLDGAHMILAFLSPTHWRDKQTSPSMIMSLLVYKVILLCNLALTAKTLFYCLGNNR